MENLKKVKEALNKNTKIDEPVKRDLESLLERLCSRFSQVSVDGLCRRLETFEVVPGSMFAYTDSIQYEPVKNQVVVNKKKLCQKNVDCEHAWMKAVLAMSTSSIYQFGFAGGKDELEALNVGFLEMLANVLVGNAGVSDFEDEYSWVNLIFSKEDFDTLCDAFFKKQPELVMRLLSSKCKEPEKLSQFLSLANHNLKTRTKTLRENADVLEEDIAMPQRVEMTKSRAAAMEKAEEVFIQLNKDFLVANSVSNAILKTNGHVDPKVLAEIEYEQDREMGRRR